MQRQGVWPSEVLQRFIGTVSQILESEGSRGSQRVVQNRATPNCERQQHLEKGSVWCTLN